MKLQHKFFLCIFIYFQLSAQQTNHATNTPQPTTINITLHTANRSELHQTNDLNQQGHQVAGQTTYTTTQLNDNLQSLYKQFYDFLKDQTQNVHSDSMSALSWIQHHKIQATGISIALAYSCILAQIYHANTIINNQNSWSAWQHGTSLENLLTTCQTKLESDLLFAIQTKYVHPLNPTDFIYSIVQSSISLKKEIEVVQNQVWRYEWINACKCLPLFFIYTHELDDVKEKLRKLLFIQHIFSSWCARYKIDKN